jgi:hypothetical protein
MYNKGYNKGNARRSWVTESCVDEVVGSGSDGEVDCISSFASHVFLGKKHGDWQLLLLALKLL